LIAENVRRGSLCVPVRKWFGFVCWGVVDPDPFESGSGSGSGFGVVFWGFSRFCFAGFCVSLCFKSYLNRDPGLDPAVDAVPDPDFDLILIQGRIWIRVGPDPQPHNGKTKPFSYRLFPYICIYVLQRKQSRTAVNWA
jgi:hypothetical protein